MLEVLLSLFSSLLRLLPDMLAAVAAWLEQLELRPDAGSSDAVGRADSGSAPSAEWGEAGAEARAQA
jgi:hypothetical protein